MNKRIKISITAIICLFLMLGTVTFAWIKELEEIETSQISADGNFKVLPNKLAFKIFDLNNNELPDSQIQLNDVIPGQTTSFKLRFYNSDDVTSFIKLTLANITCSVNENEHTLLDCMWVSLVATKGYDEVVNVSPSPVYAYMSDENNLKRFESENNEVTYNYVVAESINIPVTGATNYAEFILNFIIDQTATYEYNSMTINIGKIIVDM